MTTNTQPRGSRGRGKTPVPSRWQATRARQTDGYPPHLTRSETWGVAPVTLAARIRAG